MTVASDTSGQVSAGSERICTPPPGRSPQWWSMPGFRGRTATSPMNSAISFLGLVEPDPALLNRTCRGVARHTRFGDALQCGMNDSGPSVQSMNTCARVRLRDLRHGLVHLHQVGPDREVQAGLELARVRHAAEALVRSPEHASDSGRSGRSSTRRWRCGARRSAAAPPCSRAGCSSRARSRSGCGRSRGGSGCGPGRAGSRRRRSSAASPSPGSRGGAACSRAPASGTAAPSLALRVEPLDGAAAIASTSRTSVSIGRW